MNVTPSERSPAAFIFSPDRFEPVMEREGDASFGLVFSRLSGFMFSLLNLHHSGSVVKSPLQVLERGALKPPCHMDLKQRSDEEREGRSEPFD